MDIKSLFYTIFKSLNPESYTELVDRKISYAVKYFFFVVLLSVIIMFILFIPKIINIPAAWDEKASNFENLGVNFSFQLKEPFYLIKEPAVKIDNYGNNISGEQVLITRDGIFYKSFIFFGGKKGIPLDKDVDISKSKNIDTFINIVLWFLIPSLFFWSIVLFSVYFALIILVTFIIASMISWAFKLKISMAKVLKITIYACTIMILLRLLLMPFYSVFFIALIAYWLLVIIVVFLVKDELLPHGSSAFRQSSKKNIFYNKDDKDSEEYLHKTKNKKRSYDEENEGYIELK